ncbi:hypothetical protein A3D00_03785 [Candidatus Woesebacteria bacterium RIFCSPHIGHO2_02_FULL_38_9]|uniref:Adenylosuccinate lyase n=1 Tax=Candidatus Woesebacteria bacterium RIFCSPHIGHO2_01_FULL_39_28 TaxID=1802496 RepID=A0A1F7YEP6_9BACT|nr:MAG: hypothetical protein A2627_05000 [Candidatus Woesebacteria bacterium RIFCSPHIGHO2_01_FULL_39_28]OGM33952.1 MAG: hypothetical protein A3D00_03785 [Candidatus Woesebacteria bacterium RIFCSPHIGHO2_02_FULL_38_9]OGM57551.1 MAG: hypothetical protein A3A50_06115 [Candidatus Woesebacteria bacterium RIFCSPLOWO2_01_FULL_38_20]
MLDFSINSSDITLREGTAVSNIDGRLWSEVGIDCARYFSDEAIVRARCAIEARYLITLSEEKVIRKFTSKEIKELLNIHKKITKETYLDLRKIESVYRHDLLAMTEIFKFFLKKSSLKDVVEAGWVHWGLTTEDIDNLSHALLMKSFVETIYLPKAAELLLAISGLAERCKNVVIPGKTHLQSAVPTSLGKEIALFGARLAEVFLEIKDIEHRGKLTGAVGNLSAHRFSLPTTDWRKFSNNFIKSLGLTPNLYTTQTEPRNKRVELFQKLHLVNTVLIDFSQDMRIMTGFDWLVQLSQKTEYGSSAMPQKVNPIDFENSQGNAYFANWILEGLVRQIAISWLQRDLTDKTIHRNYGVLMGHCMITLLSAMKGVSRVNPNLDKIKKDLEEDWSIVSEGIQTYLRFKGKADAYETLKKMTRGKDITKNDIKKWIKVCKLDKESKSRLFELSPGNYLGYAKENCREMISKIKKTAGKLYYLNNNG